ncbi:MAG: hypothetical protein M9894_18395 [Planctomycetes bacterium]|nr:hypothetical protein [Planctomycetota bacterium]
MAGLIRLAIAALPLLASGCISKSLHDWATAPALVTSRLEGVEAWSASPQVLALSILDVAEDGGARRRHFWWVPTGERMSEIARVVSATTTSFKRAPRGLVVLDQRLPFEATRTPIPILGREAASPPPDGADTLVLRGEHLELWRRGEPVSSVDDLLWPPQERPPGFLRRLALGVGFPLAFALDVATFPLQATVGFVVLVVHGFHVH